MYFMQLFSLISWLKSSFLITHNLFFFQHNTLTHKIYRIQQQNHPQLSLCPKKTEKQNNIQKITYKQSGLHLDFDDVSALPLRIIFVFLEQIVQFLSGSSSRPQSITGATTPLSHISCGRTLPWQRCHDQNGGFCVYLKFLRILKFFPYFFNQFEIKMTTAGPVSTVAPPVSFTIYSDRISRSNSSFSKQSGKA